MYKWLARHLASGVIITIQLEVFMAHYRQATAQYLLPAH